jgi:hypothetical protein
MQLSKKGSPKKLVCDNQIITEDAIKKGNKKGGGGGLWGTAGVVGLGESMWTKS